MNINPEFSNNSMNAKTATNEAMSYLWDNFIVPNLDAEDHNQVKMVAVIGMVLNAVADKAHAYEKLSNGEDEENYFFRN